MSASRGGAASPGTPTRRTSWATAGRPAPLRCSRAERGGRDRVARARRFDGAWAYLELIAAAAGVATRSTSGWSRPTGSATTCSTRIDPAAAVGARSRTGSAASRRRLARRPRHRARPHHSFQVFAVYPWVGLLASAGRRRPCRCWTVPDPGGEVLAVDGERYSSVTERRLAWDGATLAEAPPTPGRARWSVEGRSLIPRPRDGRQVALHWDWVCAEVSEAQANQLRNRELTAMQATGLSAQVR